MKPTKIWANLAVSNLDRTTEFYTALGFKPNGRSEELTSFKAGGDDFIMHFFLKKAIETNMHLKMADLTHGTEVLFTLSAESTEEVDAWEKEVKKAGGEIISGAAAFGKGYYGLVFADPDGHRFNVFYM